MKYLKNIKIEQDTAQANRGTINKINLTTSDVCFLLFVIAAQRRTVYSIGDDRTAPTRGSRPPAYPDDFVELYFPPNSHHIKDDKDLPTYDEVMRIEAEAAERVAARRQEQGEPPVATASTAVTTPPLPPAPEPVTADSRV